MAIGDTYRCSLEWVDSLGQVRAVNVWHFVQQAGQVQPTPAGDLRSALRLDAIPVGLPIIATGLFTGTYNIVNLDNPTEGSVALPTPQAGSSGGEVLPLQTSILIHWLTGLRGRSYRGRTFLPASGEDNNTGSGQLSTAALVVANDFADAMRNIVATASHGQWDLVVRSTTLGVSTRVTTASVNAVFATLGNRKAGS